MAKHTDEGNELFELEKIKPIKGYPELHWTGKHPYTSTQYFPAQLKERYGEEQSVRYSLVYYTFM